MLARVGDWGWRLSFLIGRISARADMRPYGEFRGLTQFLPGEVGMHRLAVLPSVVPSAALRAGTRRATMTAPLQVIALSFSRDAGAEDRILAEVDRLRGRGVLRLLDMLFVAKSQDGTIERLAVGNDEDFGSLLAAVVPVANGGPARPAPDGARPPSTRPMRGLWPILSQPGTALAFLLVEHHWAAPLFDAIAETGGTLIGEGFLTSETGLVVGAEVAAMEEASEVIAQAQAAEADALLTAVAARAEAAEAVAESEQIQSAAAAAAVRALITAGLVEEAAAHEAVTALTAAGLIVAAADQATADAVAEDAATVEADDEVTAASLAESLATIAAADEVAVEAASEAGEQVRAASITMAEAQVLRYLPNHSPSPLSPTSWASPGRQPRSERHACIRGSASTPGTRRSAGPAPSASSAANSYRPRTRLACEPAPWRCGAGCASTESLGLRLGGASEGRRSFVATA